MNLFAKSILLGAAVIVPLVSFGAEKGELLSIVPYPASVEKTDGSFVIGSDIKIIAGKDAAVPAAALADALKIALGKDVKVSGRAMRSKNTISLKIDQGLLDEHGREAYRLTVTDSKITVQGASAAGVFYGVQTLRQMLPAEAFKSAAESYSIPCINILDYPAFAWRGLMVDSGRHYMPVEGIKRFIDTMAFYKFNTMHWHLTEDQGWRIEIKKYPKLTEVGSIRAESPKVGKRRKGDGKQYGPYFYTQDQIKDIVAYAQARFVTIVPEIEMPGHSIAALTAYPELGCTGGPYKVRCRWGVEPDIYCAGNDKVFEFLEDVMTEVMELFPSEFIHIGGDEAPKGRWKKCPKCQARIKKEGLHNEHELQSYFIRRMDKFLASHGRRLIGWDEILEGGLAPGAAVMSWRGEKGGIKAAQSNHDVVMSPNSYMYFDHYQSREPGEPEAIGGFLPLKKVYSYYPIPKVLTAEQKKHIIGVQANLWSEYIHNPKQLEYMAYPRALALAEVAWTPRAAKPDYDAFLKQVNDKLKQLDALGVNYRPVPKPAIVIGNWKSGETSATFSSMEWDMTELVETPGTYAVTFAYSGGTHRLDIAWAEILENGKSVARDEHAGTTGYRNSANTYKLKLPAVKGGAKYTLRASVKSDGGTDSNGTIKLNFKK